MKEINIKRSSVVKVIEGVDKFAFYLVTTVDKDTFIGVRCEPFTDGLFDNFPFRKFDVVIRNMNRDGFIVNPQTINTISYNDITGIEIEFIPYGQYVQIMQLVQNTMLGNLCYVASDRLMIYQNGFFKYHKTINISEMYEFSKYDERKISDVKKQNDEFMSSIDSEKPVSDFVSEMCDIGVNCKVSVISLYREYAKWCSENDRIFVDSITFHNYFAKKFCVIRDDSTDIILGVELHKHTEVIGEIENTVIEESITSIEFEVSDETTIIPQTDEHTRQFIGMAECEYTKCDSVLPYQLDESDIDYIKNNKITDICCKFNISRTKASALKISLCGTTFKNDYETFLGEYTFEEISSLANMPIGDICALLNISRYDAENIKKFARRKTSEFNSNTSKVTKSNLSEEDIEFIRNNHIIDICRRFNISEGKAMNLRKTYKKVSFYYTHIEDLGISIKTIPSYIVKATENIDMEIKEIEEKCNPYFAFLCTDDTYLNEENFKTKFSNIIPANIIDILFLNVKNRNFKMCNPLIREKLHKAIASKNTNAIAIVCKKYCISPIDAYRKCLQDNARKKKKESH